MKRRRVDTSTWRDLFAPLVAEIAEMVTTCNMSEQHARMEFRVAWEIWGLGYCRYWPYKVWRDEVARRMGWSKGRLTPRRGQPLPEWYSQLQLEREGQMRLFE